MRNYYLDKYGLEEGAARMAADGYECLKILHCHDNDGKNDLHLPPCEGNIDWRSVTQALHGIGFDGVFNLETEPTKNPDASNARKCEIELAKIAKSVSV